MRIDSEVFDSLVRGQDGVLTVAQLRSCGWNHDAVAHRIRRGAWHMILPRVVLTSSGEPSERQRRRAALLKGGPCAALTAFAGCKEHGLRAIPESALVHVAVRAECAPRSTGFVQVLPTTRSFLSTDVHGLQVVSAARAVVDACLRMSAVNDVRALVAESVQRRRTSLEALDRELAAAPQRGSRLLRSTLEEVGAGARSAPEAVLLRALQGRRLPPYELNADVHDATGRWLARPDVVFRAQRLIVEIDGMRWHLSPDRWAADVERHTRLEAAGWTVLRYSAARVLSDPVGVAAEIAECLVRRAVAS